MKIHSDDIYLLCQCAISAAFQAGRIISNYGHKSVKVDIKKGGDSLASQVVTEVDHLCQEIILQILMPVCRRFDFALLSEESPDNHQRLEKDFFWCIDPLDGTLPFVESTPGYAVSIALVARDGTSMVGVVYDPVKQTLYHAFKGGGAFINGRILTPEPTPATGDKKLLTFICDRSFKEHHYYSVVLKELKVIAKDIGYDDVETLSQGGAAMNACWVLEKKPACYFKFPKPQEGGGSLWDYAATACIFSEAGAPVSDIQGRPLDLNRPDSSFMNHRGVLYSSNHDLGERVMRLYAQLPRY